MCLNTSRFVIVPFSAIGLRFYERALDGVGGRFGDALAQRLELLGGHRFLLLEPPDIPVEECVDIPADHKPRGLLVRENVAEVRHDEREELLKAERPEGILPRVDKGVAVKIRVGAQGAENVGVILPNGLLRTHLDEAAEIVVINPLEQLVFILEIAIKAPAADVRVFQNLIRRDLLDRRRAHQLLHGVRDGELVLFRFRHAIPSDPLSF